MTDRHVERFGDHRTCFAGFSCRAEMSGLRQITNQQTVFNKQYFAGLTRLLYRSAAPLGKTKSRVNGHTVVHANNHTRSRRPTSTAQLRRPCGLWRMAPVLLYMCLIRLGLNHHTQNSCHTRSTPLGERRTATHFCSHMFCVGAVNDSHQLYLPRGPEDTFYCRVCAAVNAGGLSRLLQHARHGTSASRRKAKRKLERCALPRAHHGD